MWSPTTPARVSSIGCSPVPMEARTSIIGCGERKSMRWLTVRSPNSSTASEQTISREQGMPRDRGSSHRGTIRPRRGRNKVGAGNHFYIRHGSEVVLYAHMQKGTLNPNLLTLNAPVKAGDYLGLAGNAGSASEPHLHIHAINGTEAESGPLRPLLFHDIFTVDPSLLSLPNTAGPWARVERQGPPVVPSGAFIWPLGRNPEWNGWQDLGGPITAPPAVASWAPHRLDVFAAGTDNQLDHKWWDGSTWHNFQTLGGVFKEGPAAVSWGPNRIDVFVRGIDDHLGHLWWDGGQWRGWEDLGGPLASGPAVSSWALNRLDVFAKGASGQRA